MENNYAASQLEITKEKLISQLHPLSSTQLAYKRSPETWSINEILEHVALAENGIWHAVKQGLTTKPDPAKRSEIKLSDEEVFNKTASRNFKAVSPEVIKPVGKFPDANASLAFFIKRRDAAIEYITTTQDDLRNRYWKHPFAGTMDLYQTVIFIAGHSERHIVQIAELKQSEGFPKE